jgi:hypothetical protein
MGFTYLQILYNLKYENKRPGFNFIWVEWKGSESQRFTPNPCSEMPEKILT